MAERVLGPTLETIAIVLGVFIAQMAAITVGFGIELFALGAPLTERPWTIITSVYAHGGVDHLLANLVALAIFGFIVERRSSRWRFHAFVLGTGALAGISEVIIGALTGVSPLVVGISGAVFGLMGYILASNLITQAVLWRLRLDMKWQLAVMVVLAVAITWVTRGERVALVAHFTGLLLGLVAGRANLLRAQ